MQEITERQLLAFQRFLKELPHGQDPELVLLKGHILIEEQVRLLIDRRLRNPQALREANSSLDCNQSIRLAQAFFPLNYQLEVWRAILKLNNMRNGIAHSILHRQSLDDRIRDWVHSFPTGFDDIPDKTLAFEFTLWALFDAISEIVDTPNAEILQMTPAHSKP